MLLHILITFEDKPVAVIDAATAAFAAAVAIFEVVAFVVFVY